MADPNQVNPTDGEYTGQSHPFGSRDDEIVQVVYQSDQHGSLVGVESTSLIGYNAGGSGSTSVAYDDRVPDSSNYGGQHAIDQTVAAGNAESAAPPLVIGSYQHEQLSRAASTLPSVAEESISSGPVVDLNGYEAPSDFLNQPIDGVTSNVLNEGQEAGPQDLITSGGQYEPTVGGQSYEANEAPIYSTVNKQPIYENQQAGVQYGTGGGLYDQPQQGNQGQEDKNLIDYQDENQAPYNDTGGEQESGGDLNEEITNILSRQGRAGAVEKGSFRNNFRKKLGVSVSTNENDLTAYRRKFFDSSSAGDPNQLHHQQQQQQQYHSASDQTSEAADTAEHEQLGSLPSKFKRTHSVSFNVDSGRSNRHSVDIRNLPSYLTHKRASIVDVAKGAMSSLMSSLGAGSGGSGANSASGSAISGRRDSYQDEEPIFEEPIAPTLSLGQRVAMVRNSGAEFGTVGWIGQLPDVDDDWIVGVIFDNMIGDCDGAYNGVRYFYARTNYAMFVPLASLTKTDNYIGRPETGTMLSRMSVSLKPGQLISIQRSSIRLQHCFLNAPHQRVGHDVRAVSNRLHCQCHNCGPCAHLTKQGRINALPQFGAHHLPHRKKNSLAHAAVEMLAHHHHHFHEEEEDHEEKDYEFGDNAAHACNFVRYSCCQQSGQPGHEFSSDCGMVRPELLDNLIHAPKAPANRSRSRRQARRMPRALAKQQLPMQQAMLEGKPQQAAIGPPPPTATSTLETAATSQPTTTGTLDSAGQIVSTTDGGGGGGEGAGQRGEGDDDSSYLSTSNTSSSSSSSSRASSPLHAPPVPYNYYTYDTSSFRPTTGVYNTIDSQISFMDQQRFVYRRDSAAFLQSPKPSNWSDDYDGSNSSSLISSDPLGFKRILRCLGCMRQRDSRRGHRPRRKLSFKDKVLEYRRRQSTFVPSTLAKPHEDFASHGIILPGSSGAGAGAGAALASQRHSGRGGRGAQHHHRAGYAGESSQQGQQHQHRAGEINSDYSSCSRSSCSSSRSNSPPPPNFGPESGGAPIASANMQQSDVMPQYQQMSASVILEHGQMATGSADQLKSSNQYVEPDHRPQLDYGDFSYGDGYSTYAKNKSSRDSALTDLAYTDTTHKSNSSSDTLKHLVDQSINDQVSLPGPREVHPNEDIVSPLSSADRGQVNYSPNGEQYEISSLTASSLTADNNAGEEEAANAEEEEELARQKLQDFSLEPTNEDDDDHHNYR